MPERLLLVLAGAGRALPLHALAAATGSYHGSARYALGRLIVRGLVTSDDRRYSLQVGGEILTYELRHAVRAVGPMDALRLLASSNPAVDLLSVAADRRSAHVVLSGSAAPADLLRLRDLARQLLAIELVMHEQRELADRTAEGEARLARLRAHLDSGTLVKGDLSRVPRPGVRGMFTSARPLHRPHPSLPRLSRRTVQDLARRYGISALSLFGSATRADFRADSDVDVLVRYRPGVRRTLTAMGDLARELGELMGHRVDLVDERNLYAAMAANIARDVVRVYGRSRTRSLASRAGQAARTGRDRRSRAAGPGLGGRSRDKSGDVASGRGHRRVHGEHPA